MMKSFISWSGGKDSALALYHALRNKDYSIQRLLTNINSQYGRVSMHGVREELIEHQAQAIGLPLQKLMLSAEPSMAEYETATTQAMADFKAHDFTHAFFGDIFLEDLRRYREDQLKKVQLEAVFPLWKRNTTELVHEFIELGFKTMVVCTKAELLDESFVGRMIDDDFIKDLPSGVDPCGENGEFHTFVFDGPIFREPVSFDIGEKVFREYQAPRDDNKKHAADQPQQASIGFWFCDLIAKPL